MASLIAGHGHGPGDQDGVLGSAPAARVLSIRVITDSTDPNYPQYEQQTASQGQKELAKAIRFAVAHGAGVISMSLGYSLQSREVRNALQVAYEKNVVVVASAGNSGDTSATAQSATAPYSFPADYPGVLAVAAVNSAGQVSGFSSKNLSVQVAAPGVRVPAEGRNDGYWLVTGTSPACALTAGVVALIKSRYPELTDAQVISAITTSTAAGSRPSGGWNDRIGFGIVDAAAALATAGTLASAPPAATGVAATRHFGGGTAAVPTPPVPSRGPTGLVLYCLLAVACLTLIGFATGRLFAVRDQAAGGSAGGPPDGPFPPPAPDRERGLWPSSAEPGPQRWQTRQLPSIPDAAGPPADEQPPQVPFLPAPVARHAAPRSGWPGTGARRDS
jgi:Subtilase family